AQGWDLETIATPSAEPFHSNQQRPPWRRGGFGRVPTRAPVVEVFQGVKRWRLGNQPCDRKVAGSIPSADNP
ncbi:hypothetical protein AOLI_G00302790, partial [Acnodon oligacanthus]